MSFQELIDRPSYSNFTYQILNEFPNAKARTGKFLEHHSQKNLRTLQKAEISQLEKQGNYCSNWELVRVTDNFIATNIIGNQFSGNCALALFTGKLTEIGDGLNLPTGIYFSTLQNVEVATDCVIHRCPRLSNTLIASQAILVNSNLGCGGPTQFGNGSWIDIGIETGGRSVPIFSDLSLDLAQFIAQHPGNETIKAAIDQKLQNYLKTATRPYSIVSQSAQIIDCPRVNSSFVGPQARIVGALAVENSCIDSSIDDPVFIGSGALVSDSIIQEGVKIEHSAIVQSSMLFEHSYASHHGKVANCIIAPNTGISKGEATASFLGPFVGFHHQSMLIATFWPQGRGNVAYGANVGSNHTSRLPDQEILPGEGMFFGLGCIIKFPANFQGSPYTIIAAGIITLPQRLGFPFSLINEPTIHHPAILPGIQNLIPAWGLSDNYYALKRNEGKFKDRNKAKHANFDFSVFRPEILALMQNALRNLESVATIKEIYIPGDIPGMGKNVITESNRQKAIEAYRFFLELERCRAVYKSLKTAQPATLSKSDKTDLKSLQAMLPSLLEKANQSRQRDFKRGCEIIDDYAQTHAPIEQDPFILKLRAEIELEIESVARLISDFGA